MLANLSLKKIQENKIIIRQVEFRFPARWYNSFPGNPPTHNNNRPQKRIQRILKSKQKQTDSAGKQKFVGATSNGGKFCVFPWFFAPQLGCRYRPLLRHRKLREKRRHLSGWKSQGKSLGNHSCPWKVRRKIPEGKSKRSKPPSSLYENLKRFHLLS